MRDSTSQLAAPQDSAATSAVSTVDDTSSFDPQGYYFPDDSSPFTGYRLKWIQLSSRSASLSLARLDADTDNSSVQCPHPLISRDTLDLECSDTPIGPIAISGAFLDKRGQFWNWPDTDAQQKVVLRAVVATWSYGERRTRTLSFTYWQGD